MTAALAAAWPGATVGEVELLLRDDGTNRRARFGLRYAAGTGPATVFAKAESDAPGIRAAHARNGNMFNEPRLFSSGIPLPLEHPASYHVIIDEPGLNYLVVMEDLCQRGAEPRDASRPLDRAQAASGVRGLARLHGRFMDRVSTFPALEWVQPFLPTEGWLVPMQAGIGRGMDLCREVLPADVLHLGSEELIPLWTRCISSLTTGPQTLLHGDPHVGNCYVLPGGEVGFLDWQVVRSGNGSLDLGYFLQSALTVDERRACERDLVACYRESLGPGKQPPQEELWLRYRACAAHGFVIWLVTAASAVQVHSPAICREMVRRYGTAFADLDTPGAIDALGS